MTNNTFDPAKHLRGKDKPRGQAPAANSGGFVPMDPNTEAGSDVGEQLANAGSTVLDDQQANRAELRGIAEDCTDRQGNVYRLDLLSWMDALDEQRGDDGAAERTEMRQALAVASDDQGNVSRGSLNSALDGQIARDVAANEILEPAPFVWDKDYKNNEQVRPYYAGYLVARERVIADHKYPYNDPFRGMIPGIEGPNEDTAIYMLQTMHSLDEMKVNVADFKAAGGVDAETLEPGREYRGTVARYGWYSGGTGWQTYESARAVYYPGRGLMVTEKKKRQGYFRRDATTMIIVDKPKTKRAARP